eukprot:CAMPEP_0117065468 /NCGR_PEP_ID=MMETSP0472-20121206/45772_1 /TAXON_ID=693140 ORGANISM="Tiarina fusus, Strain LIS" /NCGR_SAMPLE_ID=MMETSP0472 /ASSEMBLY_ACC=CAM_ASM_000603 /LENGTH=218 /DNA_ID=CAMNT_0004786115 /DNA_START=205 /DNA_END=857 /DNA_ORIENTATION=-
MTTSTSIPPASSPSKSSVVKDSTNSSCSKCVKVLRDLVSGMHSLPAASSDVEESKPLQLLRAIASAGGDPNNHNLQQQQHQLQKVKIENVDDGIKMVIPVSTTSPTLLRRWSNWSQQQLQQQALESSSTTTSRFGIPSTAALATSSTTPTDANPNTALQSSNNPTSTSPKSPPPKPLTIELKCRKCASTGPEGGARAFLMGPSPLSVVVCHNRIHSSP